MASVWCIINLTWLQDEGSQNRMKHLMAMDIHQKLAQMVNDEDVDVRERVKTALGHFECVQQSRMEIDSQV